MPLIHRHCGGGGGGAEHARKGIDPSTDAAAGAEPTSGRCNAGGVCVCRTTVSLCVRAALTPECVGEWCCTASDCSCVMWSFKHRRADTEENMCARRRSVGVCVALRLFAQ